MISAPSSEVIGFRSTPSVAGLVLYTYTDFLVDRKRAVETAILACQHIDASSFTAVPAGRTTARRKSLKDRQSELIALLSIGTVDLLLLEGSNGLSCSIRFGDAHRYGDIGLWNSVVLTVPAPFDLDHLADVGSRLFTVIGAEYGLVLLDSDSSRMQLRALGLRSNLLDPRESDEAASWHSVRRRIRQTIRGAFVVNLLRPEHVDCLGGQARVVNCPAVRELIKGSDHSRVRLDWDAGSLVDDLNRVLGTFTAFVAPCAPPVSSEVSS